jgi:hypothetical protein
MTERAIIEAHWGYIDLTLKSGEVAEKGKLACIDTGSNGLIIKGKAATGLIPLGVFHASLTGDGTKKVTIKLFREIQLIWWLNDATSPVTATEVGTTAYILDDQTVSHDGTSRSELGLVLAVDSIKGVLVYTGYPSLPLS